MTWKRLTLAGALIVALTVVATAAGATVIPVIAGPLPQNSPDLQPEISSAPAPSRTPSAPSTSASPSVSASPSASGAARPAVAFATWATGLTDRVEIPKTALEAYGYAEWVLQQTRPDCKLQWTTLAAIGKVTTDHGRSAGGTIDAQGRVKPAIIGPALSAADTDAGALDGDKVKDHAVGPMQFTPSMWRTSGVDGDSDQLADPQDLDDAALSAAYQLCTVGVDLSVVANWKKAINDYHALAPQIEKVFELAQTYGTKSKE